MAKSCINTSMHYGILPFVYLRPENFLKNCVRIDNISCIDKVIDVILRSTKFYEIFIAKLGEKYFFSDFY